MASPGHRNREILLKALKAAVFLLALYFLGGYFMRYDLVGLVRRCNPRYLFASLVLSFTGFMLQVRFLQRLSLGRLSFIDSFNVEYYTLLMNLGVASSLFSLPKIAIINHKVKDIRESVRLFVYPMAFGVAIRVLFVAVSGAWVFFGTVPAALSAAVFLATFVLVLSGKRLKRVSEGSVSPRLFAELTAILVLSFICIVSSYYGVLASLSAGPPIQTVVFSEGIGYLSGFFSPMPAGLGVREFALTELHGVLQVPADVAFTAAIVQRFIVVFVQVIGGGAFLAFSRRPAD